VRLCFVAALTLLSTRARAQASGVEMNYPDLVAERFGELPPGMVFGLEFAFYGLGVGGLALHQTAKPPPPGSNGGNNPYDKPWAPDGKEFHEYDARADRLSNYTGFHIGPALAIAATTGLELLAFAAEGQSLGYSLGQLLVTSEAMVLGLGANEALKVRRWRCRPLAYVEPSASDPNGQCEETDHIAERHAAVESFPSGHTFPIASVAGANFVTAIRTQSPGTAGYLLRFGSFVLAEAMAMTTATLRVQAGAHSPSDVLGAFVLGHLLGGLTAWAHPMSTPSKSFSEAAFTITYRAPLVLVGVSF